MIIFFLIFIPFIFPLFKLILHFIVCKFGKISYDGFSAAGFSYDAEKEIFYSTKNAWQKNFGYSHLYDVLAPLFNMIIDTESIRFYYNHKNWLISFWKGQYGIVTGAEIGVYATKDQKVNKKTIYMPVSNDEMLDMCFKLYKKDTEILKACDKHWWLAIFKLGMFSKSKQLTMDIKIEFPNQEMLAAFLKAFKKLGYKDKDFKTYDCTFIFTFKKPRTRKVWTRSWLTDSFTQRINRKNVNLYNEFLADFVDNNKIDDYKKDNNLIRVNDLIPEIFKNQSNSESNKEEIEKTYKKMINNNVFLLKESLNPYKEKTYEQKTK